MIATIAVGIFIIMGIVMVIIGIKGKSSEFIAPGILLMAGMSVFLFIALGQGISIYKCDNTKRLQEKEMIEYCLENNPSYYIIQEAEEYNKDVEQSNNYFHRFTIEDRSEFKIDIDKYIIKQKDTTNQDDKEGQLSTNGTRIYKNKR